MQLYCLSSSLSTFLSPDFLSFPATIHCFNFFPFPPSILLFHRHCLPFSPTFLLPCIYSLPDLLRPSFTGSLDVMRTMWTMFLKHRQRKEKQAVCCCLSLQTQATAIAPESACCCVPESTSPGGTPVLLWCCRQWPQSTASIRRRSTSKRVLVLGSRQYPETLAPSPPVRPCFRNPRPQRLYKKSGTRKTSSVEEDQVS